MFCNKLRAVKTVRFYKRCFLVSSPIWGSYKKIVKADPHRGRLEVFFEHTKPDGFYLQKIDLKYK